MWLLQLQLDDPADRLLVECVQAHDGGKCGGAERVWVKPEDMMDPK